MSSVTTAAAETYLDLYGLSKRPFDPPEGTNSYVLFAAHRPMFERLVHHMLNGLGLAVLQGEDGSGKSAMLAAAGQVAAESGRRIIKPRRKPHTRIDKTDLIEAILERPADSGADDSDPDILVRALAEPPRAILLIDDAELLTVRCHAVLEAIVQRQTPGIVIVMTISPALQSPTVQPNVLRLARLQLQLPRLSAQEVREYIERSLWIAGGTTRRLITPDALRIIVAATKGSPGSVNRLMEATLNAGYARADAVITGRTVAAILGPDKQGSRGDRRRSFEMLAQVVAIALLLIGIVFFVYRGLAN